AGVRLVRSGDREGLGGEQAARLQREPAVAAQLVEDALVLGTAADRRHVREVFRRRAQHRRAADVDDLDRVLLAHAVAGDGLAERGEVDADQVDWADLRLLERGDILRLGAPGEDGRVDARVQRLDAAPEQLPPLRDLLDPPHPDPPLLQAGARAAAGDDLDTELDQALRELVQAGLVVDGDEGALDHVETSSATTRGSN